MTQVRTSIMGEFAGFDYPAVKLIADAFDITMSRGMWDKVRAVEMAMRRASVNNTISGLRSA